MTPENLIKSQKSFTNEELGFLAALLLGDGSLAVSGRMVIAHGLSQKDYCDWKAKRLSVILNQEIKALPTRQCTQIQIQRKTLKTKRMIWYPENKKSIVSLLNYIINPLEAIAIWICDDGNNSPSIDLKTGKCYSSSIQIFTFTDLEETIMIADWFEKTVGIRPNILYKDRSKTNRKSAYIIRFKAKDSRTLYKKIKPYLPKVKSIEHKFRYIEHNLSTRPQQEEIPEKIV